jgi:hypothetical protein
VKPCRTKNRRATRAQHWWLLGETLPALRAALAPLRRYVATPRVSKYRLFVWLPVETLPDSATFAFARDDDYFFGVLHSRFHELWALKTGTALENRPRYTPSTTFDTYPFPWALGYEPSESPAVIAISDAARRLVKRRDAWLNPEAASAAEISKRTLTNLYNQRPQWLQELHTQLNQAVASAYGWSPRISDDEVLERLLALNHERYARSLQRLGKKPSAPERELARRAVQLPKSALISR